MQNSAGRGSVCGSGVRADFFGRAADFLRALNPCVKLVCVLVFLICVVSSDKYGFSGLLAYLALPIWGGAVLGVSFYREFLKSLPALVLAAGAGVAGLFFDTDTAFRIFGVAVSFGGVAFCVLMMKAYLCVWAAVLFAACTDTNDICAALGKFKVPCLLVFQIMLTARYLEVVCGEAGRIVRAYALRSPSRPRVAFSHFPHILVSLLLRSIERSDRIFYAMKGRGFDARAYRFRAMPLKFSDALFGAVFCAACILIRVFNVARALEFFVL